MIPTESRVIDGQTFHVKGLDLRTERSVMFRLLKVLGPAFAVAARSAGGIESAAPEVLESLLSGLKEDEVEYLIEVFSKVTQTELNNEKKSLVPYLESAFTNGASSQMKWLWFCLEHQFGAFLGEKGRTFLQSLRAKESP